MKQIILTSDLINNALDFYNTNLGEVFFPKDVERLTTKLLENIEYDYIIKSKKLPYDIPQNTLYLIYFIGEYKKAYQYSIQNKKDKKDKNKDTLEALGKGFIKKEKAYKEGLEKILDESLDVDEKIKSFIKTSLLLFLKKPSYKKASILFLGTIYTNLPLIKIYINQIHQFNTFMQTFLDAIEYTLKYFQYTHVAESKILNSSLIIIYTVLNQNLKIDEDKAFKYAKELVNSFIDSNDYSTDKYRKSYLTEKPIYYAGIYQGLPIYQWYVSKNDENYYTEEDIKKIKVIIRVFLSSDELDFTTSYIMHNISKLLKLDKPLRNTSDIKNLLNDDNEIRKLFKSSHTLFAVLPWPLLQHFPKAKKTLVIWIISVSIGIFTKFADLKTKFSKK